MGDENRTKALLANPGHMVFHAVDPITADYASSLVGSRRETFFSPTDPGNQDVWDMRVFQGATHVSPPERASMSPFKTPGTS